MSGSTPLHPVLVELRAARLDLGLSQPVLAALLGMRFHTSVNRWECGVTDPQLWSIDAWAAVLGYRIALAPVASKDAP